MGKLKDLKDEVVADVEKAYEWVVDHASLSNAPEVAPTDAPVLVKQEVADDSVAPTVALPEAETVVAPDVAPVTPAPVVPADEPVVTEQPKAE